jgi:DNA-binding MarR family transcriptional regulator
MQFNIAFLATDVGRLFRKRFEAASNNPAGLTGPQWRLLRAIERHPGATQIALANLLEVEPITAGRMIDRLARGGMVERRPDPADRRAWRLHLTHGAEPHLTNARTRSEALIAHALAGLSDSECEQLASLLQRVRQNLVDHEVQAGPELTQHG